jgi:O-antigen ligase
VSIAALDWRDTRRSASLIALVGLAATAIGAAAVVSPPLALAAAAGSAFLIVALRSLALGVAVLTALTFFERIPGVPGGGQFAKGAAAVIALSWILRALRRDTSFPLLFRDRPFLTYAIVAFCVLAASSMLWAPDVAVARSNAVRLAQVVFLVFAAYSAADRAEHVRWIVWAFMTGAAITALVGLLGTHPTETVDATAGEANRLAGQIGDANEFAAILVPALALAAFSVASTKRPAFRALLVGYVLLFGLALFLTESRGGLVGLGVTFAAALLLAGRLRPRALALMLTVGALGVGYYTLVAPPQTLQRITHFTSEGGTGRTDLWSIALQVAGDHPLLGAGWGNFVVVEPQYATRGIELSQIRLVVDTPKVAHNMYLQVLAELGLVGLTVFLAVIGSALALAYRAIRTFTVDGWFELEAISRGLLVGVLGMLAAYSFISAQYEKQLWLLVGVAIALPGVARRGERFPLRRPSERPDYDPRVADQLVRQLEERVAARIDELVAEQEKLARRQVALAQREAALREAHRELDRRRAELDARERGLGTEPEHREARDSVAAEYERRQAALNARAAATQKRERDLERRESDLERRERELAAASAWPTPHAPPPPPALAAVPASAGPEAGGHRLEDLERLVAARGDEHPERVEEWRYYLLYLRDYSDPDGYLPASVDWLIADVFGDLLEP